jgi:hypothetical protein
MNIVRRWKKTAEVKKADEQYNESHTSSLWEKMNEGRLMNENWLTLVKCDDENTMSASKDRNGRCEEQYKKRRKLSDAYGRTPIC